MRVSTPETRTAQQQETQGRDDMEAQRQSKPQRAQRGAEAEWLTEWQFALRPLTSGWWWW